MSSTIRTIRSTHISSSSALQQERVPSLLILQLQALDLTQQLQQLTLHVLMILLFLLLLVLLLLLLLLTILLLTIKLLLLLLLPLLLRFFILW